MDDPLGNEVHPALVAAFGLHLTAHVAITHHFQEKASKGLLHLLTNRRDGLEALSVVEACLRIIAMTRPVWWCLENPPVGRLRRYLGPPAGLFDPADYGDPYTKRTCLWGRFTMPRKRRVVATEGSKMHRLPPSPDRWRLRSETPAGFASAFFEVNP